MNKIVPVFCFVLLGICAVLFNQSNKLADQVLRQEQILESLQTTILNMNANVDSALQAVSVVLGGDITSGSHQFANNVTPRFNNLPYCMRDDREIGIHFPAEDGTFTAWYIVLQETTFDRNNKEKLDLQGRYVISGKFVLLDAISVKDNERVKRNLIINNMLDNGQIVEYHSGIDYFNYSTCPDFVKSQF